MQFFCNILNGRSPATTPNEIGEAFLASPCRNSRKARGELRIPDRSANRRRKGLALVAPCGRKMIDEFFRILRSSFFSPSGKANHAGLGVSEDSPN